MNTVSTTRRDIWSTPPVAVPCPDWCTKPLGHSYDLVNTDNEECRFHSETVGDEDADVDALYAAQWRVAKHKTAGPRIADLTGDPCSSSNAATILALQIGDRIVLGSTTILGYWTCQMSPIFSVVDMRVPSIVSLRPMTTTCSPVGRVRRSPISQARYSSGSSSRKDLAKIGASVLAHGHPARIPAGAPVTHDQSPAVLGHVFQATGAEG